MTGSIASRSTSPADRDRPQIVRSQRPTASALPPTRRGASVRIVFSASFSLCGFPGCGRTGTGSPSKYIRTPAAAPEPS